jgi:hypothetical protein
MPSSSASARRDWAPYGAFAVSYPVLTAEPYVYDVLAGRVGGCDYGCGVPFDEAPRVAGAAKCRPHSAYTRKGHMHWVPGRGYVRVVAVHVLPKICPHQVKLRIKKTAPNRVAPPAVRPKAEAVARKKASPPRKASSPKRASQARKVSRPKRRVSRGGKPRLFRSSSDFDQAFENAREVLETEGPDGDMWTDDPANADRIRWFFSFGGDLGDSEMGEELRRKWDIRLQAVNDDPKETNRDREERADALSAWRKDLKAARLRQRDRGDHEEGDFY